MLLSAENQDDLDLLVRRLLVDELLSIAEAAARLKTTSHHLRRAIDRIELKDGRRLARRVHGSPRVEDGLCPAEATRRAGITEAAFSKKLRAHQRKKARKARKSATPKTEPPEFAGVSNLVTLVSLVDFGDGRHAIYRDDGLFYGGGQVEAERRAAEIAIRPGHKMRRLSIRPGWLLKSDVIPAGLCWIPQGARSSTKSENSGAEVFR